MMVDPVAIALEVNREATSIGAAGYLDEWPAVELIHYNRRRGVDPIPAVAALHGPAPGRRVEVLVPDPYSDGPVPEYTVYDEPPVRSPITVVDPRSGGYRQIKRLRKAGIKIHEPSAADVAAATGEFLDMADSGAIRQVGCAELDAAVRVLMERKLAGATAFDRFRSKGADVGPAIACILALWAMRNVPRHPPADIY